MVKKKVNKAGQIRSYVSAHPDAKPAQVAKALKMSVQYVYQVLHKTKSTGLPEVKDTVTRIPLAHMAELAYQQTSGRDRRHPITGKRLMQGADIVTTHHADMVNHPAHYKAGGIETIDYIEAKKLGYHLGNVIKYVSRADHKGQKLEDLKKAQWYLSRAIENENKNTR
jgi:transposase